MNHLKSLPREKFCIMSHSKSYWKWLTSFPSTLSKLVRNFPFVSNLRAFQEDKKKTGANLPCGRTNLASQHKNPVGTIVHSSFFELKTLENLNNFFIFSELTNINRFFPNKREPPPFFGKDLSQLDSPAAHFPALSSCSRRGDAELGLGSTEHQGPVLGGSEGFWAEGKGGGVDRWRFWLPVVFFFF